MSDARTRRELEALVEALDDEPIDEAEGREAVKQLGIDVKKWAGAIRARVAAADGADRGHRFDEARIGFEEESKRYEAKSAEPRRSLEEQRAIFRSLSARVPQEVGAASVHFHKFDEATADEIAEMIKALRHLLNEDE